MLEGIIHNNPNEPAADSNYSIVVAGHGSRDHEGIREFEDLVMMMRERAPGRLVEQGYLEFAVPTIDEAIRSSIAAGSRRIVLLPALLMAATHAKNDMPIELAALRQEFTDTEFHFGAVMELHPLLLDLMRQRIIEAEALSPHTVRRADTCLVVVGRGTSDPDANSQISKLTRMLEEGMGFGASYTCYSGTAAPLVLDCLKMALRFGKKRIIVVPYFLFNGVLIKRIYDAADTVQARNPEIDILKADYLGVHPHVADVFLERADEGVNGRAHMNCGLCKYRVQIVGSESFQGAPQMANHWHARGKVGNVTVASDVQTMTEPYRPHPIEAASMEIIENLRDWSGILEPDRSLLKRLVHSSGDSDIVDEVFISPGAVDSGAKALLRCRRIITDVTMVESGLNRKMLSQLGITVRCGVHDIETRLVAESSGITRSAAGIRLIVEKWGNDVVVAIGDAPTAVMEVIRLVNEHEFRPQLVVAFPVGFVGTLECKEELRRCINIPRITNHGTKGGSPWAAAALNALMIEAMNYAIAASAADGLVARSSKVVLVQ